MSQRERIIEQTARMFVELGIKSIRMDDIAHTLGISKRTLYEKFTDKEELIYLCMKYLMDEQLRMVAETTADCDDKLEALFNGFKLMLDGGERHHRMMTNLQKFYPAVFDRIRVEHIRGGGKPFARGDIELHRFRSYQQQYQCRPLHNDFLLHRNGSFRTAEQYYTARRRYGKGCIHVYDSQFLPRNSDRRGRAADRQAREGEKTVRLLITEHIIQTE